MNDQQLSRFRTALAMLPPAPASLAASGGVLLGKDYRFDLVRPGIGLYRRRSARQEGPEQSHLIKPRRSSPGGCCSCAELTRAKALATQPPSAPKGPRCLPPWRWDMPTVSRAPYPTRAVVIAAGGRRPSRAAFRWTLTTVDVSDLAAIKAGRRRSRIHRRYHVRWKKWPALAGTNAYEILTGLQRVPRHYTDAVCHEFPSPSSAAPSSTCWPQIGAADPVHRSDAWPPCSARRSMAG